MSHNSLLPKWTIEQALPEDAADIAALHSESYRKTYLKPDDDEHNQRVIEEATQFVTPERIALRAALVDASLMHPDVHFYHIASLGNNKPIGMLYGIKTEEKQEIVALYVDKKYYGTGVGQGLAEEFIQWSDPGRPIELGVYKENDRAKKFYTKMGFEAMNDERYSHYEFLPETTMIRKGNKS